jgi:hypothetical protein
MKLMSSVSFVQCLPWACSKPAGYSDGEIEQCGEIEDPIEMVTSDRPFHPNPAAGSGPTASEQHCRTQGAHSASVK